MPVVFIQKETPNMGFKGSPGANARGPAETGMGSAMLLDYVINWPMMEVGTGQSK
jgi:hypothetical protein